MGSEESLDPLAVARSGHLNRRVSEAMETARTLARRRMPVILSAWSPPCWACALSQPPGLRGTALNPDKLDRVCSSLASYLVFLKESRGVEARFSSFNEPETGVEVRQTAAEHVQFLTAMGAELVSTRASGSNPGFNCRRSSFTSVAAPSASRVPSWSGS